MQIGTQEEIDAQYVALNTAEDALCMAKLRLRALLGQGLMQAGDSFPVRSVENSMKQLSNEFGSRNLRMM